MTTRRINEIRIGSQHRRDLGNLDELAESIRDVGLLHPIVIQPDNKLICGERRLEACKRLGLNKILVNVVDIDAIVRGELAENTYRKNFFPSEMVAISTTIEQRERAEAKRRQLSGLKRGKNKPVVENYPNGGNGKSRDKIAKPLGISGRTLEKAKVIIEAAEAEPEK
jgi:ParB family transcriptional regulator, chromosome partitioning protein